MQGDRRFWPGSDMTEVEPVLDFASSGRSGRRNALPDILGSPAGVNPTDLPLKLAELSLKDGPGAAQSPTGEDAQVSVESSSEGSNDSTEMPVVTWTVWGVVRVAPGVAAAAAAAVVLRPDGSDEV
ncbi:hypothetical protein CRUP_000379 [Coryphaenoides rupestris]|nr:hypothetical protein CRUP_000379 [Coryphaenoides rupestris]